MKRIGIRSMVVYTAITNEREQLRDDQQPAGGRFLAFVDQPWGSPVWEERPAQSQFFSPRRNARFHKILAHHCIDAAYSLWIDGNVGLRVPIERLVDEWLQDCDLATFRHRTRDCTYQEGAACIAKGLDEPSVIEAQMGRYRRGGLPAGAGLPETSMVLRRHNRAVESFNNCWWSELCGHSVRDQLAFMYAVRQTSLRVKFITPTKFEHPYFDIQPRPAGVERPPQSAAVDFAEAVSGR